MKHERSLSEANILLGSRSMLKLVGFNIRRRRIVRDRAFGVALPPKHTHIHTLLYVNFSSSVNLILGK